MAMIDKSTERQLEIFLVLITLALGALLYSIEHSRIVVLNLFYLPVVLAGFFLGRYRAGTLALLSVVTATVVIMADLTRFSFEQTPVIVALSVMVWGAILGITAILIGTLNEDRNTKVTEVHEAHVGVVEVLSRYLQCADPVLQVRTKRVNHLCEQVAIRMRMTPREIDDLRVAALLMDVTNIEITARVIRKAVGDLDQNIVCEENTFHGTELVKSLGASLSGAFPLVLMQNSDWTKAEVQTVPIGARVLRVVRHYVELTQSGLASAHLSNEEAIKDLKVDFKGNTDLAVINVLEEVIEHRFETPAQQKLNRSQRSTVEETP